MSHIVTFGLNPAGKDYAVGDIHGCFGRLERCLARFFDPAVDRLFAVGDLVDRGPQSEQAESWLLQPWFYSVKGNHDDMAQRWPAMRMDAENYAKRGGGWNIERTLAEQIKTAAAFGGLPLAIEVQTAQGTVGIVHAECPLPSWTEFRQSLLGFDSLSASNRRAVEGSAMWERSRAMHRDHSLISDVRAVVVGHERFPTATVLGNHYYIDTGACFGNDFTFIDLATLRTFQIEEAA